VDTAVTDHLLSSTRAVRRRLDLDRPVEPQVVLDCLRIAIQAPTGSNSQGWRWLVVTDPDKRAAIADHYRDAAIGYLTSSLQAAPPDSQDHRVFASAIYLTEVLHRVPIHVIPCIRGRPNPTDNEDLAGFYGSILPAAWSFLLALRSRGLGASWTTLHLRHESEVARLLGIPDDVTQVALFPVAYTVGTEFAPATRRPIEELTYWNTWGEPTLPG
jgi:nitroreductase